MKVYVDHLLDLKDLLQFFLIHNDWYETGLKVSKSLLNIWAYYLSVSILV